MKKMELRQRERLKGGPAGLARDFTFKGKKAEAVFRAFAKEQR